MQQIMFIEGMKPLEEVPFTNREGKADVLPKQEFVLSDGINTIVAETVGNYARAASQTARGWMGSGVAGIQRARPPDKGGQNL